MNTGRVKSSDTIQVRLDSIVDSCPDLRVAAHLYRTILPLVGEVDAQSPLEPDLDAIQACLKTGIPVISAMNLEIDLQEFARLMIQLVCAVESMPLNGGRSSRWKIWQQMSGPRLDEHRFEIHTLKNMATDIRRAVEAGQLDVCEILECISTGDIMGLEAICARLQLDSGLLMIVAKNALKPALNGCRKVVMDTISELQWDKGYCFVCGSRATLGELRDNEQVKHLRCGQCGADWSFNRLECTHCGNIDHRTQRIISEAGCDSRRIDACDACHGYLKVIASFSPTAPELVAVEDLATLPLDYIAQQRGYNSIGTE